MLFERRLARLPEQIDPSRLESTDASSQERVDGRKIRLRGQSMQLSVRGENADLRSPGLRITVVERGAPKQLSASQASAYIQHQGKILAMASTRRFGRCGNRDYAKVNR